MDFTKSQKALERALKTVPLASQTFSKSYQQFPQGAAPLFLERGQGGRVWDIDGNEFVDLVSGLMPVVLGYKDPDIDQAIRDQLDKGIIFSMATELEYQLAEKLVDMIPCAEMVRYGKNGTDATSAAIRLARAYTRKDHVIAVGYHGWQDWYIGATTRNLGVPQAVCRLTTKVPYNDLDALKEEFKKHEVACVIMEPMNSVPPAEGYLNAVKEMAHKNGALFVLDEIITGFRYPGGSAQAYFDVTPDMAAFGKAMGNGMPISAIVGRADIMNLMNDIFYSGTFGGEALSLAASIAVIDKMAREPVIDTIWRTGTTIAQNTEQRIKDASLQDFISLAGNPCWKILQFRDHPNGSKEAQKTFFVRGVIANNVLVAGSHNINYAHDEKDIHAIDRAYEKTLGQMAEILSSRNLDDVLDIPAIRPIFSVR